MPDGTATNKAPEKTPPEKTPAKPQRRLGRSVIRWVLLVGVPVAALAVAGFIYATGGRFVGTDDAFTKADTVPISADVSARVVAIEVHDNQQVKAGQVLFRLDDEAFRLALAKAESKMAQTRNDILALQATYRGKQAGLRSAQAALAYAQSDNARQTDLAAQGYAAKAKLDDTRRALDMARQQADSDRQAMGSIAGRISSGSGRARPSGPRFAPHRRHGAIRRHGGPSAKPAGRHVSEVGHSSLYPGAYERCLG